MRIEQPDCLGPVSYRTNVVTVLRQNTFGQGAQRPARPDHSRREHARRRRPFRLEIVRCPVCGTKCAISSSWTGSLLVRNSFSDARNGGMSPDPARAPTMSHFVISSGLIFTIAFSFPRVDRVLERRPPEDFLFLGLRLRQPCCQQRLRRTSVHWSVRGLIAVSDFESRVRLMPSAVFCHLEFVRCATFPRRVARRFIDAE